MNHTPLPHHPATPAIYLERLSYRAARVIVEADDTGSYINATVRRNKLTGKWHVDTRTDYTHPTFDSFKEAASYLRGIVTEETVQPERMAA